MRYVTILFMVIFLGGCVPYSDNPLTDPNCEKIDAAILGTWFWNEESDSGFVHIGLNKESKLLQVIMIEHDKDGTIDVSEFNGHTSSLGNNKYLNLKWVRPADEPKGYLLIKYSTEGESLTISILNAQVIENAIKEGSLKGTVGKEKYAYSLSITEEQKKLQQFVLKHDKELFQEKSNLNRLNLPQPNPKGTATRDN
ncbi:MAG TPA: hypothetical protein VJ624_00960 [Thermodesulfobacteriota bacterium]|jgi:hypothetical protein|nr:hypothetical protein [Thermodesulfobacteriota bacterium]